jgi:hypothetical protein
LLTNSIAVVGEVNPNSSIDPIYLDGIFPSPYENLTSACIKLIQDDALRKQLENKAFETISQYPQKRFTAELLS